MLPKARRGTSSSACLRPGARRWHHHPDGNCSAPSHHTRRLSPTARSWRWRRAAEAARLLRAVLFGLATAATTYVMIVALPPQIKRSARLGHDHRRGKKKRFKRVFYTIFRISSLCKRTDPVWVDRCDGFGERTPTPKTISEKRGADDRRIKEPADGADRRHAPSVNSTAREIRARHVRATTSSSIRRAYSRSDR